MESANALIIASGKTELYRFSLLYYPVIKWMIRAMESAGVSKVAIVCDDPGSMGGIDFSEFLCQIKLICLSGYTGTKEALKDTAKLFAGFDGPVLVFDAPMPALTGTGICAILRNRLSVSQSGVLPNKTSQVIRILYTDAGSLNKAFTVASGFSINEFAHSCQNLSLAADRIDGEEFLPAIDMPSLAVSENTLKRRTCMSWLERGVYIQSPDNTFISPNVKIDAGAQIFTGSILYGDTAIGKGAAIGPNSLIESSKIGAGTTVNASQVYESIVGENTKIGPFAYIRPGCTIGNRIKIGDFVELKKATIGDGTKVSHLTYIGDAEVGQNVNFGCGTVTVNYDGNGKYLTRVEDDAFIGCNTNLVAPVTVHRGAYTAAGTTITRDVPEGSLAIGRCRETIKENWVISHQNKNK